MRPARPAVCSRRCWCSARRSALYSAGCTTSGFRAAPSPTAYAVVGLTAFFTAVVRAPLTGICLAVEMTGSVNLLLPMLAACFGAMVVMNLLGIPPIYDLLRERAERRLSSGK